MSQTISPGFGGRELVVAQAEPRRRAGRQVLHDDVGLLHDQALEDPGRLGMLHVEREAFLGAVGPDEVRRQAAHALVVAAGEVARAGALDLDDAGAEVGQLAGGEGRRDRVLQRDDGDAFEWLHGLSLSVA